VFVIAFIASLPGFMNAFLISTILMGRRSERKIPHHAPGCLHHQSQQVRMSHLTLATHDEALNGQ